MELKNSVFVNTLTFSDCEYEFSSFPTASFPLIASEDDLLNKNLWSFYGHWEKFVEKFYNVENLYNAIQDLYTQIREIKEKFRPMCISIPELALEPNTGRGVSGSYFLVDQDGKRHYVVKPLDEDVGCIHSNGWATPFLSNPIRRHIPLYQSSMREALAYEIALNIGVSSIVPKTSLTILKSDQFYDLSEGVDIREIKRFLEQCGPADKEKLCSIQEYVQNSKTLFEAMHELQNNGLSDEEIKKRLDQADFEDANILLWTTYDTDGHAGNFLVYSKGIDSIGNEVLGLKKIDNGLAFPDKNREFRNTLSYLPNASLELSQEAKEKIRAIDVERLATQLEEMGLESAVPALKERMTYLKSLAQKSGITIKEINQEMAKIGIKR